MTLASTIDIDGVAAEISRLRGGLSDLVGTVQKSVMRQEEALERSGRHFGARAWKATERNAGEIFDEIDANAGAVAGVVLALTAAAGLYFVLKGSFQSRRRLSAPGKAKKARTAAAEGIKPARKRAPKAVRKPSRKN